nr:Reduced folate carrier domain containing protein [Haemonchus contortus]
MRWQVTTFILCTYGFLKSFRPTEPFLYQYEHETLNISEHVLNAEVYPIWTYSYMITLIPVLLLTDLLLYKAVIVFEAVSYIVVWSILVFCSTVFAQQMLEIFYGWATATEIAYFAFIYVKVSKEHFRKATSLTRGAILLGSFLSYAIAQLIILLKWGNYQTLNIISLTSVSLSLVFAIALPAVPWKSAYEKKMLLKDVTKPPDDKLFYKDYVIFHFKTFIEDLKGIYGNSVMLKWSLWWALATCGYLQIGNYTQTLWGTLIPPNASDIYNGLTEALCPLISLPAVLLVQHLRVDWSRWGELCLANRLPLQIQLGGRPCHGFVWIGVRDEHLHGSGYAIAAHARCGVFCWLLPVHTTTVCGLLRLSLRGRFNICCIFVASSLSSFSKEVHSVKRNFK